MSTSPVNPYAAPRALPQPLNQEVYFTTATKNLSIREYWWLTKNPIEFCFGVLLKLLRVDLPVTFGMAHPRYLEILKANEMPDRPREKMTEAVTEAIALGFHPCLIYTLPHIGPNTVYATTLHSDDGNVMLGIIYGQGPGREVCKYVFGSYLQDGRIVATLSGKPDLESPPEVLRESVRHQAMPQVLQRHRQRLREIGGPTLVIRDAAEVERIVRWREERMFDYQCQRGVFVRLSEQDFQRLVAQPQNLSPAVVHPGIGWSGTLAWIVLGVGLYLNAQGPPANPTQLMFRLGILVAGAAGVVATWVLSRRRAAR